MIPLTREMAILSLSFARPRSIISMLGYASCCSIVLFIVWSASFYPRSSYNRVFAFTTDTVADRDNQLNSTAWMHTLNPILVENRTFIDAFECLTLEEGATHIVDSAGRRCVFADLNQSSNCCPSERDSLFTCSDCLASGCCSSFVGCVSCCMGIAEDTKEAKLKAAAIFQLEKEQKTAPVSVLRALGEFYICRTLCLSNSQGLAHQNTYASPSHHCFSRGGIKQS